MPRDAGGNYTLPVGNPVVSGTIIESVWANTTMSDIAAALTNSLSRTGQGGMLVPFRNADGTVASPGVSWTNEPTSGWYRKALNEFWYSVGNEDIFQITKLGIQLAPGKTALGISSFIRVQDAEPSGTKQGEQWFESDQGGLYMRYQNPDLTFTWILTNTQGGDFIPASEKGVADGVASLDATGKVPAAQLPTPAANIIMGTPVSAAGQTAIEFTGLPVGIKRLSLSMVGISGNGSSSLIMQIGSSAGYLTSGYLGSSDAGGTPTLITTGFLVAVGGASNTMQGRFDLAAEHLPTNSWVATWNVALSDAALVFVGAGWGGLPADLDRVRVTFVNGTDVFDAGRVNIQYEL